RVTEGKLRSLVVRQQNGEVVLDDRGQGVFKKESLEPGFDDVMIERVLNVHPARGVFTVHLELSGEPAVDTWFIVHALSSSTTPQVLDPARGSVTENRNSVVAWVPFHSPESADFEGTTINVYVGRDDKKVWNFWLASPGGLASVRVGSEPKTAALALDPGEH